METILSGLYYHVYNRGNNKEDLFRTRDNYIHFLRLYETYIHPVAETYAWVLMKNHFHLLIRVREHVGYKYSNADRSEDAVRFKKEKWETNLRDASANLSASKGPDSVKAPNIVLHFSHLFNAYTKYYNVLNQRSGKLFQSPFKRIHIDNEQYFQHLIMYIHKNPIHHGFTDDYKNYPWSSYGSMISDKPSKVNRNEVLEWFDGKSNFIFI